MTVASGKVHGAESKDSIVRMTLLSMSTMPDFTHKTEFKVLLAKNKWKQGYSIIQNEFLWLTALFTKNLFVLTVSIINISNGLK